MDKEELIIQYFENSLSPDQAALFNEYMQQDPAFAAEVQFRQQLKTALELKERESLKQLLQEHEASSALRPKPIFTLRRISVAAAILAIAICSWLLLNKQENADNKQLYARYFDVYPNVIAPITRSTVTDSNTLITRAFLLYESGDYNQAIPVFTELFQQHNYSWALFYSGICYMQKQEFKTALSNFNTYLEQDDKDTLVEEALWYKSLSLLQLQQTKEAITHLQIIILLKGKRGAEATELLQSLPQ